MKIVQIAIGKFHHFHLARQLDKRGYLKSIYSGYPWFKLKSEGIAKEKVKSFPWLQSPYMMRGRLPGPTMPDYVLQSWEWWAQQTLARYAASTLPECDAVVALSASGLYAGRKIRARGGKYICDRGSTHIRFQNQLLAEEHNIWNIAWKGVDPRIIDIEEQEYDEADYITVPSTFNLDSFSSKGVSPEKMRVISYGANITRFQPVCERDPNKFIILFVGQISLRKGIPYLLEAFKHFKHPRKELWIVGNENGNMGRFRSHFTAEGIKMLGRVPNTELASLYSQAHAFVLPSIEEGLALVQGEALACGCPIIASTNTGACNLFNNGVEGFIVPIRSADRITDCLTPVSRPTGTPQINVNCCFESGQIHRWLGSVWRRLFKFPTFYKARGKGWGKMQLGLNKADGPLATTLGTSSSSSSSSSSSKLSLEKFRSSLASQSATSCILITLFLMLVVYFLPVIPSLENAAIRMAAWFLLLRFGVGPRALWNPGPTSWFIITMAVSYGSWTLFYFTGRLFFFDSRSFLSVCGSYDPQTGFEVDTGCFLLTGISWIIVRAICHQGAFARNFNLAESQTINDTEETNSISNEKQVLVFLFGLVGAFASLPSLQAIGSLAQPMLLMSYFFPAAIAVMLISSPTSGSIWWRYRFMISLILVFGLVGFVSSGAKGVIFMNLFFLTWLHGSRRPRQRFKSLFVIGLIAIVFIVTLPVFQRAKDKYSTSGSAAEVADELLEGFAELFAGKINYDRIGANKGGLEATWEYLGIRLCVASMTHIYYQTHYVYPKGTESLTLAIQNMLPRLLDPNKQSSNAYYNEIARTSGIGNYADFESSRKPSFIDEVIICWGGDGFLIGGLFFGFYLAALEYACFRMSKNRNSLQTVRFMLIPMGQLPYFAVMFGAVPYIVAFAWLIISWFLATLWAEQSFKQEMIREW